MMRKYSILAFFLSIAAFAFGQASVGAGVDYGYISLASGGSAPGVSATNDRTMPALGFSVFVDSRYLQFSIGYTMNSSQTQTITLTGSPNSTAATSYKASWLDLDLVGKLPFHAGDVTLFPLVGLEYLFNLTYTDSSGNDQLSAMPSDYRDWLDMFMVKAGFGADIPVSDAIYIRPEAFAGIKIAKSRWDTDQEASFYAGASSSYWNWWELRGTLMIGFKI
jgi:hypothetical protein